MLITICIVLVILIIFVYLIIQNEHFEPVTVSNIAEGIAQGVAAGTAPPVEATATTVNVCDPKNWWEEKPIKAIRSKMYGASYNVNPVSETGNINTPVLIPLTNPNNNTPSGCIAITNNGWHESVMCSTSTSNQQWIIKMINNQADFQAIMAASKNSDGTSGFTYGYKIDKVDYPFCMVISRDYPSYALYYASSALGVRPVGNYDDQKWDILPDNVEDPLITSKYNYYTKLTPELQVSQSNVPNTGMPNQNNQNIMNMLQQILKTPNTTSGSSGPFKVNVEMDKDVLSSLTNTVESFTSYNPKKPIDISVSLGYNTQVYNGNPASGIKTANSTTPAYQLSTTGKLEDVKLSNTACSENVCHPNMDEWSPKPYPCKGCVASEGEVWN